MNEENLNDLSRKLKDISLSVCHQEELQNITDELKKLNSLIKKMVIIQMVNAELNNEQVDLHTKIYEEHND